MPAGAGSLAAASKAEQASGAAQAVFGKDYPKIEAAANKAATAVGLSRAEYQQMAAVLGAGLKNQGLKDYAEHRYTDSEFEEKRQAYAHARPFTKESLLYREIFETYYPGQSEMVADFWMPNRAWKGCDVNDPSARVLANYGDSGK